MNANQIRCRGRLRGFSLLELLLVIGLLALLLAILLPCFATARRQARVVWCASNLRQISAAAHAYAMDNKGHFPDLTSPGTGGNLWDVSHFFTAAMLRQNLDFRTFLCPASQIDPSAARADFYNYSNFNIVQYNIWIPRLNGADVIPPAPTYSGTRFMIVSPAPVTPFAGPAGAYDTSGSGNPIVTDIVATNSAVTPPANADPSQPGNPYDLSSNSNHMDGLQLAGVNWGFADGHVEFHIGNEVRPYYRGNWWNWR